ncbi:hypothetical protein INR49_027016, partial [Caranx melampygus]
MCVDVFLALSVDIATDVQARMVRNHVSSICSTWGRGHFKTFDGDVYQFPEKDGNPTVSYVVVIINDLSFHLSKIWVKLPYYNAGVQVEKNAIYVKLQSKVGLTVMWNLADAVMVELDQDYTNRTCGLCGDFNGVPVLNEFMHNGRQISPVEFGSKQKVHHPNDDCEDPYEEEDDSRTVFDDISKRGCIPQSECQCFKDKIYNSGEVYQQDQMECTCLKGKWDCKNLQTSATCAVEEGSHVTTFDGKPYTFHGDCYYTLAKVESKDDASPKFTIMVQLVPCANQEFDTCLRTLKILINNDKNNVLTFSSDGTVKQNMQTITLPYHSGDINIFHASSFHILLQTTFGLQIQIQQVPLMQVYVRLDQSYRARHVRCMPTLVRLATKRCTYASCNCEKNEACLCAVLSSYARACASKGVFLINWREKVCDKYSTSCPATQTFSYKNQRCQLTCRSLSSKQQSCTTDFLPVDGCSCSEGLYLNDKGLCVPMEKCPCYHNEKYIKPGKSINIKDEHCVCTNGVLHCRSWRTRSSTCLPPKVFFNCSTAGTGESGVQCARTCLNLDPDECDSTDCESGCMCPTGLLDDGKGSCVKEKDCPCQHNGYLYAPGTEIRNQCNNCTCKSGKWACTEKKCPGTCVIYGSGHYSTFDQRTYAFQGHCAYIAVQNKCGNQTAQDTFRVITENVPCGSTGTTCSKTVRIQLGRKEIKLSKGNYEEEDLGHGTQIPCRIRTIGLYLVIESAIGVAVMWDRRTTVRILLEPRHSGEVCGLCGDFDGNVQNDFTTQGQLVVSNPIEFGNSWKVTSTCPDVETSTDPCVANPNRHYWAKMMCSIITGEKFKNCHNKVDPLPFHENCVKDSCSCDTGGDCECFCTAVAAYAQACSEAGVCVAWRTPEICRQQHNSYVTINSTYHHRSTNHNHKIYTSIHPTSYNNTTNHNPKNYNTINPTPYYNRGTHDNPQNYDTIYPTSYHNYRTNHHHNIDTTINPTSYHNRGTNHNHKNNNPKFHHKMLLCNKWHTLRA